MNVCIKICIFISIIILLKHIYVFITCIYIYTYIYKIYIRVYIYIMYSFCTESIVTLQVLSSSLD
jgi:hypothetical protein